MLNPKRIHSHLLAAAMAISALVATPANAQDMTASLTAPTVDAYDIANYAAVAGTEKWWAENSTGAGSAKGQTFTTGIAAVEFKSISYQIGADHMAVGNKTYVVRVGTVSGTTFTEVYSETFTQDFTWNADEYMTWEFNSPPILIGNTTYAVDIGMTGSTSNWQSGIPYLNKTANEYTGGQRYSSGQSGIGDTEMHFDVNGEMVFHLDLAKPTGPTFELVAGNPVDDSPGALVHPQLVATFSRDLVAGTGDITIWNLTDSNPTTLPLSDPRVSLFENLLLIETPGLIEWGKSYAVRIDPDALDSDTGESFAGISDDTTWNFTVLPSDPLLTAIAELKDHINEISSLDAAQIAAHKQTIDLQRGRFDDSAAIITAVFDLVETYDAVEGPLWIARGRFTRSSQPDDLDWTIYHVMQGIVDGVYNTETLAGHEALLDNFKFGSSANFPGAADLPADPSATHTATINGSFPNTFGRNTQGWTLPARKPTGCYLAPGTIVTVTVPASLVGQGYKVRIGAHSWDLSGRPYVERLDRSTILYPLDATTIKVASPLGGGIYIEVPMGATAGVVDVDITGAIRSPYFSVKSFHTTTDAEWIAERDHPAPWADFQTDKFMMQVPANWVDAVDNPTARMADWDAAMDAINDLMGFPRIRGKETMYIQTDLILRSSVHAPGYPAVNVSYNPDGNYNGDVNNYFVQGPRSGASIEFHEQGHAYGFPKFGGESESNVNLLYVPVLNKMFGFDFDYSFAASFGFQGNPHRTVDNTAVTWMTVFNFSPREVPMHTAEKAYQLKGHAKFVDIARLFGWEGLDAFWYSYNLDLENGVVSASDTDSRLLRLCQSVGEDIRPLFHFWGVYPVNPPALEAAVAAENLGQSSEIYELLLHYKSLVPADNAAFRTFAFNWWNKQPSINGNWTEREHSRQWDTAVLYGEGDQQRSEETNPSEIYNENSAADITGRMQELIDLYYPTGRPIDDYGIWAANFPAAELIDPNGDITGNGLTNNDARIWGLAPTDNSAVNPISVLLNTAGTFSYTRRDLSLTELSYEIWTSTDLVNWTKDGGASEDVASNTPVDEVETVTVTLTATPDGGKLFAQVRATE